MFSLSGTEEYTWYRSIVWINTVYTEHVSQYQSRAIMRLFGIIFLSASFIYWTGAEGKLMENIQERKDE